MKKLIFTTLLFCALFSVFGNGQTANQLSLIVDFNQAKGLPTKIVISRSNLGNFERVLDTARNISNYRFQYQVEILEPQLTTVTFYWKSNESTSVTSWMLPDSYQIIIGDDLKLVLKYGDQLDFISKINSMESEILIRKSNLKTLLKNVNYEGQKISDVEQRISFLRDSVDKDIDESIYLKYIKDFPNTPLGLYALCKYAERPYTNQRIKSEPERIDSLLNKLNKSISNLPSGKILSTKLALGKQMVSGNEFPDISLPDTIGKIFKISDYRGKYLLVDFWASWCMPCREENPMLIQVFQKYRNKGFQLVNITIDDIGGKKNWLSAIKKDRIGLWPQLSDFDKHAQMRYGIRFIPANYLLNPEGKIIARDLRGKELDEKLENIFKQ